MEFKVNRFVWILQFALCLLVFSQSQAHADTIINFDSLSEFDSVTNQFSGLTFSNTVVLTSGAAGGILNELEFPPHSDFNVASDDGGPITVTFSVPILSFGGYFTYFLPLTLTGFDAANAQVAVATSLFSSNLALSGDSGSSPNELLSLAFASGISKVTIAGDPAGGSFSLDDLTYQAKTSPTVVPEPANRALLFLISGAVATVAAFRRRFQPS